MAEVVRMPKMSDTMTEGVIVAWHKQVGDTIQPGDVIAEVETDKAVMELEAYESGTLLYIGPKAGETVAIDAVLYIVGEPGESYEHLLASGNNNQPARDVRASASGVSSGQPSGAAPSTQVLDLASLPLKVERMPKMSDTMTEGVIVVWHKQVGDTIQPGDVIAEVETDKAVMELEAYESGKLVYIGVEAGKAVRVDDVLYVLAQEEIDLSAEEIHAALQQDTKPKQSAVASKEKDQSASMESQAKTPPAISNGQRIKISPLARRLAKELGVDVSQIQGTGEGGRIIRRDIEAYQQQDQQEKSKSTAISKELGAGRADGTPKDYEDVPLSQMRKTIARRLAESKFTAPHFYLTVSINMEQAIQARQRMNELSPVKISFNDLVVKAAAMALMKHPQINASWMGESIRYYKHAHIGVAVAVPEGLVVPVVRYANQKSLAQIAEETKTLADKAKNRKLQPAEWEGSTFTISNLGMFGIEEFTAIINPPDACILAVGSIQKQAVVLGDQLQVAHLMKVTLSCDHRVVDGALGAAFLQTLKANLEEPLLMLV